MKSKSISGKSTEDISVALQKSMSDNFKPALAFVFISIRQDIDAIRATLDQHDIKIFGASSAGEFIDGEIGKESIAILLLDLDPSGFILLLEDYSDQDPVALAGAMAAKAVEKFKKPSFIISGSVYVKPEWSVS
ncbi:FIST N-terminal domain-containing protein [Pollutibacter soli]|uniref:FIST N-terminal domain-containing protein n=1 Tax=Pollutibacter soli TaxID=3034157 RepID=UPI0030136020